MRRNAVAASPACGDAAGKTVEMTCQAGAAYQPKPWRFTTNPAGRSSAERIGCLANAVQPMPARSLGFPHQALEATRRRAEQA